MNLYNAPEGEAGQLRSLIEKIRERRSELLAKRLDIDHMLDELGQLEQRCDELLARKRQA